MKYIPLALVLLLAGCIGPAPFTVKQVDNRFSNNKDLFFISSNNRISTKSIVGGTHISDDGVFINPFVSKDRASGKIILLGFYIHNLTDYSTSYGDVNQLGFIEQIVFRLDDDQLITLPMTGQRTDASGAIAYNAMTGASYNKTESGMAVITQQDFAKLVSAKKISCKITGTKRSVIYEASDISQSFMQNLRSFQKSHLN